MAAQTVKDLEGTAYYPQRIRLYHSLISMANQRMEKLNKQLKLESINIMHLEEDLAKEMLNKAKAS